MDYLIKKKNHNFLNTKYEDPNYVIKILHDYCNLLIFGTVPLGEIQMFGPFENLPLFLLRTYYHGIIK